MILTGTCTRAELLTGKVRERVIVVLVSSSGRDLRDSVSGEDGSLEEHGRRAVGSLGSSDSGAFPVNAGLSQKCRRSARRARRSNHRVA